MTAKPYATYVFGITGAALETIKNHCGTEVRSLEQREDFTSQLDNITKEVLWLTLPAWLNMHADSRQALAKTPKILVLPAGMEIRQIDQFGSLGFSTMLVEPLNTEKVCEAMSNALEERNIYRDAYRMTREIMLERELLERKNENLNFLVDFLSNTSGLLLPDEILKISAQTLNGLLPVNSLGAFLWRYEDHTAQNEGFTPCMFIPAEQNTPAWKRWEEALLDAARSISRSDCENYEGYSLYSCGRERENGETSAELSLVLPLLIKESSVGAVIINLAEDYPLGRDTIEVLESAMSHLALALRSTWLYKQVKNHAEHDALTGLHNRRVFDSRLQHEIERHERYGHELGLIILDIDFFKSINDEFGHLTGDEVLRETGSLLKEELRCADCVSRYGGEEFVALLPYTGDARAWALAERLRRRIENHDFCGGRLGRKITVSLGITGFRPEMGISACQMINRADIALYRAKRQGRNCSVLEEIIPELELAESASSKLIA